MLPRLCRINDTTNSSAGWWAVASLPGVIVYQRTRDSREWCFYCYPPAMQPDTPWSLEKSGNDEQVAEAEEFVYQSGLMKQSFATRRAALQALKVAQEIL